MGNPRHQGRGLGAAASSIFFGTGFGLALAGRPRRGFAWLGAAGLCAFGILLTPWSALAMMIVHVAAAVDAYRVASRSARPLDVQSWGPPAIFVTALMGFVALRSWVIDAFKIPSSSMSPTLVIGDHIYVNRLPSLWRNPRRGELVVFVRPCDPSRDFVSRVVALPGESVEVRCNIVHIDGKAVPQTLVAAKASYMDYDEESDRWYERAVSRYRETLGGHTHDLFSSADRPERDRESVHDFPMRGNPPPSCAMDSSMGEPGEVIGTIVESKPDAAPCDPQIHYVVPAGHVFVLGDSRDNSNDSRYWGAVPIGNIKGVVTSIFLAKGTQLELGRIGRVD